MKLLRLLLLALLLTVTPALAQENTAVYTVADVNVDVTAASAAQARDQGLMQAQRQAFDALLARMGATGAAAKATDDMIAKMVQSFEIQKEHAAGKRYIGALTVAFKPEAVRAFLQRKGASYTETRAQPYVVLPVLHSKDRDTLWEDRTPWRDVWDDAPKDAGLVPLIVPAGDLDDIAKISTAEAFAAKAESLEALAQKYKAGGALVVILKADPGATNEKVEGAIEAVRYDLGGRLHAPIEVKLDPAQSRHLADELKTGMKNVLAALDASWRQDQTDGIATGAVAPLNGEIAEAPLPPQERPASNPSAPAFLPVDAPVPTLAAWAQIRNKLRLVPAVVSTNVVTMTRGLVHAEIQFHGDIPALQAALAQQGLVLDQGRSGGWEIRQESPTDGM